MPPLHKSTPRASLLAAAAAATISFMVSATAAEPGASDAMEKATQGSSKFYLRAGASLERSRETRFLDQDCASTSPAALYGCGPGSDGAPLSSVGDFGTTAGLELGVGRSISRSLRIEGKVQYRPSFSFEGHANFTQEDYLREVFADASSVSTLVAAYLDLPPSTAPRLGALRPFVGAGIGLSRIEIDETRMQHSEARTISIVPGGRQTNLAWMLAAGVAIPLNEKATLDFEWRYTDLGTVETGRDKLRIVWRDGSRQPFLIDLGETRANLASHGLHVSLRYAF